MSQKLCIKSESPDYKHKTKVIRAKIFNHSIYLIQLNIQSNYKRKSGKDSTKKS